MKEMRVQQGEIQLKCSKEGLTSTEACLVYSRTRKEGQRAQSGTATGEAEQDRSVTARARPHGTV